MTLHRLLLTRATRPLLALVAAHGVTDVDCKAWPSTYVLCLTAPIPPMALTPLFCVFSLLHFAEDVTVPGSAAVHAAVALIGAWRGLDSAAHAMLLYLALVHVPAHYARCFRRGRHSALGAAAVATVAARGFFESGKVYALTPTLQRIVMAHVSTEFFVGRLFS